jgi:hypothetical protein
VTAGDKAVDLPGEPPARGPITDKDFLTLQPGKSVTLELSRFALALEKLPPGEYSARVRFWQDPRRSSKAGILSPAAEFVVRKQGPKRPAIRK